MLDQFVFIILYLLYLTFLIETIANDTTEYTATNIIPTTDGQSYTNKKLSLDSCRPSIDSSSPVSRIGSNAQCKSMKIGSLSFIKHYYYTTLLS